MRIDQPFISRIQAAQILSDRCPNIIQRTNCVCAHRTPFRHYRLKQGISLFPGGKIGFFAIQAVYIKGNNIFLQAPVSHDVFCRRHNDVSFNRYDALMPQLDRPTVWDTDRVWRGVQRSAWGYFKKLAVADRAAVVVDTVFANPAAFDRTQLLLGGVLFTVQLYADFSGYTDIVLGVGEVLGLHLPENFRQPFFADSVKDIWARWHISLSQWLRDYIYIPLGGSRCSKARKDGNLIITFLVSGLWHGAGLTYLVWGGLHGLCQAAENHLPPRRPGKLCHALRVAGTFCILAGAFVIFRASSLANAAELFKGILCNGGHAVFSNYWELGLTSLQEEILLYAGIAILLAVDAAHERGVSLRTKIAALPTPARWAVYEVCIFVFLFMGRFLGGGSFLYARY